MNWANIFRDAIRNSERTLTDLAKSADMQTSQLSYFMREQRGLSIDTAERLAAQLGLELVSKQSKSHAPARKKKTKN